PFSELFYVAASRSAQITTTSQHYHSPIGGQARYATELHAPVRVSPGLATTGRRGIRMNCQLPAAPAVLLAASAGTTERLAEASQTATEELLISTAVDHAVAQLNPSIPAGTKVFVDAQYYDNAPGDAALYTKYAIGSIRDMLLRRGARLVD